MSCKGTTREGVPCRAPEHMVDASGFCHAHGPGARDRMAERGRKGAISLRRKVTGSGLSEEALGPLTTHADAKRWLELIGRAVACGKLGDRAALAAIKAVSEWVKAEGERVASNVLEQLRHEVDRLKEDLEKHRRSKLRPVFEEDVW